MTTEEGPGVYSMLPFWLALFLFASTFTGWWMNAGAPWWLPYLL